MPCHFSRHFLPSSLTLCPLFRQSSSAARDHNFNLHLSVTFCPLIMPPRGHLRAAVFVRARREMLVAEHLHLGVVKTTKCADALFGMTRRATR